jgi:hypothetical protein
MAYRTGDPWLLARQLANKIAVLELPIEEIERDESTLRTFRGAQDDLNLFLRAEGNKSFTDNFWFGQQPIVDDAHAEAVRRVAQQSEMLDWLQTMAASGLFYGDAYGGIYSGFVGYGYVGRYFPHPYDTNLGWLNTDGMRVRSVAFVDATRHAIGRWRRGDGLHWAVAAMARIAPEDPERDALLAVFDEIERRSRRCTMSKAEAVAYAPMFFHAVRLRLTSGAIEAASQLLTEHRTERRWYVVQAVFESLRYLIGRGQAERARQLLAVVDNEELRQETLLNGARRVLAKDLTALLATGAEAWQPDLLALLNLMPVRVLAEAGKSPAISEKVRANIVRVAWTRAYLLREESTVRTLTPTLRALYPELVPYLDRIAGAWSFRQRDNMTTMMLLRVPRMSTQLYPTMPDFGNDPDFLERIDRHNHSDNNWWCRFDVDRHRTQLFVQVIGGAVGLWGDERQPRWRTRWNARNRPEDDQSPPGRDAAIKAAIDELIRTQPIFHLIDWEELRMLEAIPNGAQFLSERVIRWAETSTSFDRLIGRDELLPEALHLSVRATRYGCQRDGGHGRYSRKAFTILHRQFADTEWAKRTPYWFDCAHFFWAYRDCSEGALSGQ